MLAYDYSAGSARLDDLPEIPISPHLYVLCDRCATSLRAPRGWVLDDRRGRPAGVEEPRHSERLPHEMAPAAEIQAVAPAETESSDQRQLAFGYSA